MHHHLYADDTHIYIPSLSFSKSQESIEKLQHCVMTVSAWMTGFKFKLNPSKTLFLLFGTTRQREKCLNNVPCLILCEDINPSASAKNLDVVFDSSLKLREHIHVSQT